MMTLAMSLPHSFHRHINKFCDFTFSFVNFKGGLSFVGEVQFLVSIDMSKG